jgi:hypothetical protein
MKTRLFVLLSLLIAFGGFAADMEHPPAPTNASFDHMKSLVGVWQGTSPMGDVKVTYELISNNTALMETISSAKEPNMVTIYYPDGKGVMMTHYCSDGNQPRMHAAASTNPNSVAFTFVDITNLASPQAMHMHDLTISWKDKDHITQDWVMNMNGTSQKTTFVLARAQ